MYSQGTNKRIGVVGGGAYFSYNFSDPCSTLISLVSQLS